MTTLFHSTVESLRARGVSIPDDVDRALQLITANAEVRKTNDGASLVDGAYASGELTPANLLGKLTELSVLQFLRSLLLRSKVSPRPGPSTRLRPKRGPGATT
jgi:hypothetical protein